MKPAPILMELFLKNKEGHLKKVIIKIDEESISIKQNDSSSIKVSPGTSGLIIVSSQ